MKEQEFERLTNLKKFENELYDKGYNLICGIDEVGRGPLARPVVIASVIMKKDSMLEYVNDSKKVTPKRRQNLIDKIKQDSISWSIATVFQDEIDDLNILNATKKALTISLKQIEIKPEVILVDALNNIDTLNIPYISIIKGDEKSYSISCASILAKVTRDNMMVEYSKVYPQYGFDQNKGYGTKKHIEAIKKYGICPLHRKSFVKNFI